MTSTDYSVGGIFSTRPFRLRRLGHVAFDVNDFAGSLDFFARDLGLLVTDILDLRKMPDFAEAANALEDPRVAFLSTGADHHCVVLLPRPLAKAFRGPDVPDDIHNAHISFQLSGADEVVASKEFLEERGTPVLRMNRDFPGSNWHCYFQSPDGVPVELYYGMEQIGWQRRSKPNSLYRSFEEGIDLPVASEASELDAYLNSNPALDPPVFVPERQGNGEVVAGVMLDRPFRITRIGPVSYFVKNVDRSADYYKDLLGMTESERVTIDGGECVFLRAGTEHHSLALYAEELRGRIDIAPGNRNFALGMQVGSYDQLRRAGLFLGARGWRQTTGVPPEFYTGIDRALFFEDPHGHRIMLYYYIEQIGWDGRPRPSQLRLAPETRPVDQWPDCIHGASDVFADQPLTGPLG